MIVFFFIRENVSNSVSDTPLQIITINILLQIQIRKKNNFLKFTNIPQ